MNDEGLDAGKTKDRGGCGEKANRRKTLGYLGFLSSFGDHPPGTPILCDLPARKVGRSEEAAPHMHSPSNPVSKLGVGGLAWSPCVPCGVILIVWIGNPAPSKLSVGSRHRFSPMPQRSVRRERIPCARR